MRLVRFVPEDAKKPRIGAVLSEEEGIADLQVAGEAISVKIPSEMRRFLEHPCFEKIAELVARFARETGTGVYDPATIETVAPITRPEKIVCVGLNYIEHAEEGDEDPPEEPILFSKFPTSIVGPGDAISWDHELTQQVDYEVEFAVVVRKTARRVSETNALEYVAGYTVANDVSARDLQFADEQWVRGKSLDTFCPLGPELVTAAEIDDPHDLDLWTEVNGERVQESNTSNLIFDVPSLVSFCSEAFTLRPGDLILTGTPPGVGIFRDPPLLLSDGDEVTVAVEGVGELTNYCQRE